MKRSQLLLIIDMISAWDFEGADPMVERARGAVENIDRLRREAGPDLGVAYANDLEQGFHGSRERSFSLALAGRQPELVLPLEPDPTDDFIHKGQHSAFYGTPLAHLLDLYDTERLVLTGQVTEQCVLYTALDAHVRGYDIVVVTDAVVSSEPHLGRAALEMIEKNMHGDLVTTEDFLRA